jgi:hypothetical protein
MLLVTQTQRRIALLVLLVPVAVSPSTPSRAQDQSRTFPETGKTVRGAFLRYWDTHGGLPQQGYPISDEMRETSDIDGKTYTVQYFQRAVFELHPEHRGTPHEVLLSLLGSIHYRQRYPTNLYPTGVASQAPNTSPGSIFFPQTGKRLGGEFLEYWQKNGGLAQQGYPITDEFYGSSELDGKAYRMQFFERAVFEYHPKNEGTPYVVLLAHLGTLRMNNKYAKGLAPPYDVIWRTVREIMSRYPQDPNSKDTVRPKEFLDYEQTLRGMRAEGWQGWMDKGGPLLNADRTTYRVTVYMEDPAGKEPRHITKRASLQDISREQASALSNRLAKDPNVSNARVRYSGVITLVHTYGGVELTNVSIEPVE